MEESAAAGPEMTPEGQLPAAVFQLTRSSVGLPVRLTWICSGRVGACERRAGGVWRQPWRRRRRPHSALHHPCWRAAISPMTIASNAAGRGASALQSSGFEAEGMPKRGLGRTCCGVQGPLATLASPPNALDCARQVPSNRACSASATAARRLAMAPRTMGKGLLPLISVWVGGPVRFVERWETAATQAAGVEGGKAGDTPGLPFNSLHDDRDARIDQ